MALKLEFSTEPFDLERLPAHAAAARRAVEGSGLAVDVGPFGTSAVGREADALAAAARLLRDALEAGATRISLQVEVVAEGGADRGAPDE